ncbi:BTAD domain-containing putative transcriptional regulator [Kribbella sancticallisti]|uniref:BTAD domain-containing putative transcriptional regulator n=1 Tax=Kribbella sancticallisti TaxID=460087 RepID=A0ABP4PVG5_9ACTN
MRIPELKVRAVLADLLVHLNQPVSADRLTDHLYSDAPPARPGGALQLKVSRLRKALDEAEPGARSLVVSKSPGYLLSAESESVDAELFQSLVRRAQAAADPRDRARLLADALRLWRGPAYADFADEPFTRSAIVRLEEERLVALEEQAEARLDLGEHHLLVGELGDLVTQYPLRQRLRAAYLTALYRSGRHGDALDSYEELRRQLADELGLDPAPELVALQTAILRQDPELTAVEREPVAASNLPVPLTELIGRESAVREVRKLLTTNRLLTLVGHGGVGKTRLALAAAEGLADAADGGPADGVWLVELAALDRSADSGAVAGAALAVLGIREQSHAASRFNAHPTKLLVDALRNKQLLLAFDNCEHVVAAVAELVDRLLREAPELQVLATSQEALGVPGEVVWAVPPLELPSGDAQAELAGSSAVRLFLARAGLDLEPGNAAAVVAICRGLDGIPLALELAAARVRALGVHELAARLDDRLQLLSSGRRTGPARQQTLRAMIAWSWELLAPQDQAVLRRLSAYADSFTLESAQVVANSNDLTVLALVDRSLIAPVEVRAGRRYRLLESVRAYAAEQLADETQEVRHRHLQYYADLVERAEPHLHGANQRTWLDRLDQEAGELRHALEYAVQVGDAEYALRLVDGLVWYWFLRGRLTEARRAVAAALSLTTASPLRQSALAWATSLTLLRGDSPGDDVRDVAAAVRDRIGTPEKRARVIWALAFANRGFGDPATTDDLVDLALSELRAVDDRWGVAAALNLRATLHRSRSELADAERDAREAEDLFRELGDRWGLLKATSTLAELAEIDGDYDRAGQLHRTGLRLAEELELWSEVSFKLSGLGRIALLTGDLSTSAELHAQALQLAADQLDQVAQEFAEIGLALTARRQGRLDAAENHLSRWLSWLDRVDGEPGLALVLAELGFIAELRGDPETALARHLESQAAAKRIGDPRAVALALEGQAGAHSLAGRLDEARQLLAAAAALRTSVGAPLPPAESADLIRIGNRLGINE